MTDKKIENQTPSRPTPSEDRVMDMERTGAFHFRSVPGWIYGTWGGFTALTLFFVILSHWPKTETIVKEVNLDKNKTTVMTSREVFSDDFESGDLSAWTVDWMDVRKNQQTSNLFLYGTTNLPGNEQTIFVPHKEGASRGFYAQSPVIPIRFDQPYSVRFLFNGYGPIDMVKFGHIRLRLNSRLPNLSFDAYGKGNYRILDQNVFPQAAPNSYLYAISIQVDPQRHHITLEINNNTKYEIIYNADLNPVPDFYIGESLTGDKLQRQAFAIYDDIAIRGVPSRDLSNEPTVTAHIVATPAPVIDEFAFRKSPEFRKRLKSTWDIYNKGEMQEAITSFKKILKDYPKSAEACHGLGLSYRALGDSSTAQKYWNDALSIDSSFAPARQFLKQ